MEAILKINNTIRMKFPWKQIAVSFLLAVFGSILYMDVMNISIGREMNIVHKSEMVGIAGELTGISTVDEGVPASFSLKNDIPMTESEDTLENVKVNVPKMNVMEKKTTETANPEVSNPEASVPEISDTVTSMTAEITVIFHGNGGTPEITACTCNMDEFDITSYAVPTKTGMIFDGWYIDSACTKAFDSVIVEGKTLELYAGWKVAPTFLTNEKGEIIGYSDASLAVVDGMVVLPGDADYTGIRAGAFDGIENEIFEIYIPANITFIEEGVLETLPHLMYIEVADGNPSFYSEGGVLYRRTGEVFAMPEVL